MILRRLFTNLSRRHLSTSPTSSSSAIEHHVQMCLNQKLWVLRTVNQSDYCQLHGPPYSGSVAGHMRHSIDHISKLVDCYLAGENTKTNMLNIICYDDRERNTEIETSLAAALQRVETLQTDISGLLAKPNNLSETNMVARFIGDCNTGETYDLETNFARELSFVCHHATHHLFFMKMMMEVMQYDVAGSNVGVANSTILHHAGK